MRTKRLITGVLATIALGATGGAAIADKGSGRSQDTQADFTPGKRFAPLASSVTCTGAGTGREADPFAHPAGYEQTVFAEESPALEDLWDMHTQNESGTDSGRYVYRTHEVGGQAAGEAPAKGRGGGLSVTDLRTGETRMLIERNDFERFDGLVWTPWGTLLAAEEVTRSTFPDPTVPQAQAGLVYEFFLDEDNPMQLDPSREPITPDDGTTDTVQDGVRARPALGSRSHEGLRFDKRGNLYGIAESRGQTTDGASGGIFKFVPEEEGDLSEGDLYALQTRDRRYGEGRWVLLDDAQSEIDSDAEAERKGANEYQRPEDVETGASTGKDANNGGQTVYVAITEGEENGVIAIDVRKDRNPFAYPYVGPVAGNAVNPDLSSADNLALDREGNLAITEDPGGDPPPSGTKTQGDDIWVAQPTKGSNGRSGRNAHKPASEVARFASLKDCAAEPSGVYFAMKSTDEWTEGGPFEGVVTGQSLLVHRMHSGQGAENDQSVVFTPVDGDRGKAKRRR